MKPFLRQFVESLRSINWSNVSIAHSNIERLLKDVYRDKESLYKEIESHDLREREYRGKKSYNLPTHLKWYLHRDLNKQFEIWIHEYKPEALRGRGYANVPHNHRYWFTSLLLRGSFTHKIYEVEGKQSDLLSFGSMQMIGHWPMSQGDVYTLDSDKIHSLTQIDDTTLTLIVSSRQIREYSEEFVPATREIRRHDTIENIASHRYIGVRSDGVLS